MDTIEDKPVAFSMSFECKKKYGLSLYVFNSPTIVEYKIAKLVGHELKRQKHVSIMSNDPSIIMRYFGNILNFNTLNNQQKKLLEFNRSMYRQDDVDVLIYPDINKLDEGAIKQALRLSPYVKVVAFCSKEAYEAAKTSKTSYRPLLETAIKDSESTVVI
jgi:hypothetical protein